MKIGIIDADLLGRVKHRFPNLVCEKISAYWKEQGAEVILITDTQYTWLEYSGVTISTVDISAFQCIYISKVFTDTKVPAYLNELAEQGGYGKIGNTEIHLGGTGFYFDKAPSLPDEIEHHMPDYHLYDSWISNEVTIAQQKADASGTKFDKTRFMIQFKEYTDYSIGFLTRGCFRKCQFCVNQKYDHVFTHSPLAEFYDTSRKKICLLDDNFLGCAQWKPLLTELIETKRPFKFKQGLDERILTEEKCQLLFNANYDSDLTFAFDNYSDYELIENKLELIQKYRKSIGQNIKFYVLVGFESTDIIDIEHTFARIELLFRYHCLPYIMRYQNHNDTPWKNSEFRSFYIALARWCNQPRMVKKMSFREFCLANQANAKNKSIPCSTLKTMQMVEEKYPYVAEKYFDMHFGVGIVPTEKE